MTVNRHAGNTRDGLVERIHRHTLPNDLQQWVDDYDETVGDRDAFLWRWGHQLFPEFRLSCVAPEHDARIRDAKMLGLMFVSILDDVAEKHDDGTTFSEASKIPRDHVRVRPDRDGVDGDLVRFAGDVWDEFESTLVSGPRSTEFEEIVRFDLHQVVNAIYYSHVANHNVEFITKSQLQAYETHNMMLFGFAGVDLVHSPAFDVDDLSTLRQVIDGAQRMVRIGNWVTTWERELHEGDVTSGVVAYALERDLLSAADLRAIRTDGRVAESVVEVLRRHDLEEALYRQWEAELATVRAYEDSVDSVDVHGYLDGIETVMEYHLASEGLK